MTDHLGSVVAKIENGAAGATDVSPVSSGVNSTLISEQRYLPFGQVREDRGTIAQTDFGYTGQTVFADGEIKVAPGFGRLLKRQALYAFERL